jgi:peptide/nickel transport system substrate-binding protein
MKGTPVSTNSRRIRAAAGIAGLALVLAAGCTPAAKAPGGKGGKGTLVIAMTASDIPLLDTGMCQNEGYEGIRFVGNQMYDGLTKFDLKQGTEIPKIIPGLASSWESNPSGEVWTFHLREGVKFHDGTPFDADAALYNLQRYTDKTSAAFYQELNAQAGLSVQGIKSVRKVDAMTIEITTKEPWSYLPVDLATVYFGSPTAIKKAGNKDFAQHPIGTGPFKFVSVTRGQQLVYEANKEYWGGAPKVDKVVLRPIPDATARTAALRAGEVNWIEVPPPDDVPQLTKDGYQVLTNSYDHIWPWVFDMSRKPWNDVRVRQAANYAIDRQSLVDKVLKGTAEPALQASPKANASYRPENDIYGFDPAKAKALLAEAGYANGFTTTLSYPTSGSGNMIPGPMNEALQQNLAAVGIKVELKPVEWASMLTDFFVGKIPGGADMLNISLSYQQEGFWSMWYGTGNALNTGKYSNPKVDALFKQAKKELDANKRSDLYAQASAIVTRDAPWLFVVDDKNPRALAPNVKGFVEPKSWFADLTTVSVG